MLFVLDPCQRKIQEFPEEIRGDLADALARLDAGQTLSMPLSRAMPDIGPGVHELRLKDRSGAYRVIYFLAHAGNIYLLHAFKKKTRTTSHKDLNLAKKRLRETNR